METFVILRNLQNHDSNFLWKRCYNSVRKFYPENKIVIIDDNSRVQADDSIIDSNTNVIKSEFPGSGEILPYYYLYTLKFADKIVILQDSMYLKRKFTEKEIDADVKFHWQFSDHRWDDIGAINYLLYHLENGDNLAAFRSTNKWHGMFGVAGIITYKIVEDLENKYKVFTRLVRICNHRLFRCGLERVLAILLFNDEYLSLDSCSNFGEIHSHPQSFEYFPVDYDPETDPDIVNYHSAIIKTWHER